MPRAVYLLAVGIFAMVTSEFVVAGLMPQMADGLDATIPQIGYLITAFAVAMAAGGPLLTVAVLRIPQKQALMVLFAIFLVGNMLAAVASSYGIMMAARIITGIASQAFFGVAISMCVRLTRPEVRGRAVAVVMNGLMLGTLLGLPLSTLIGERLGWRAAFWAIAVLTVIAAVCTAIGVPRLERADGGGGFRQEVTVFRNARLWLVLSTSTLIIGATFSAFSYFNPILTEVTGFSTGTVPLLLIAYGAATVVGNNIVGRLADRHTLQVLLYGLLLNVVFLTGFALLADVPAPALVCMMGIGLVGVTMNPAMVTRVQRAGNAGPLVNTVHSSFITLGIIIGSSVGGLAIDNYGLRAPLWLGAAMAVLGLASLLPDLIRRSASAGAPETHAQTAAAAQPETDKQREEV
ncbi:MULTISPECIES: MFS transporter [unclassified Streptomyces]|uniref:MFS transporter n=1 Tax=unclassified Streptomyces TaxID=2593676 RepID=UPI00081EAF75|nr:MULTISPECIES: MFS transporter [unclassified Streptomyces]MYZ35143.1 MFS transporter [Streptomyces sp. SID4917]SCF73039.1 Predicted arabinose efflux permease, MFS family [Streptomyces sp. MnatMP-M17]